MRVTDKMGYNQVITNLQKNRGEMADLQNQAATQKKLTKPSDDPVGSARVLALRTDERGGQQFTKNIQVAKSFLDFTDVALNETSEVLVRMKELAIQQANDAGGSSETRRTVAEEVQQSFSQLVQIGNRKMGERYIFGGFTTTHQPFDNEGNYHGDDGELKLHVNKDAFVAMNLPGDKVFLGKGLGDGFQRIPNVNPMTTEDLEKFQQDEAVRLDQNQQLEEKSVRLRGPANVDERHTQAFKSQMTGDTEGVNVLNVVRRFEVALRTNDKKEVQECIDDLDQCLTQVINSRAQVGGRLQALAHTESSLKTNMMDNQASASLVEDVDLFHLASEINKSDSALKATLETSGKMITPSLLDFLK